MQFSLTRFNAHQFINESPNGVTIDVRTPAEYQKGHIPGSINLPLFTNEERVIVGTLYKQVGKEAAMDEGLKLVGPKLHALVSQAKQLADNKTLYIYCWRGGMRSGSVAWLLQTAGFKVVLLNGGYKNYRRHFMHLLKTINWQLVILGGPTGSGKTEILYELEKQGEQIIDLEKLANHKGSAFGSLGENPQPTNEHFENLIHHQFTKMNQAKLIWFEGESHKIGSNFIANELFALMKSSPFINLNIAVKNRVGRLVTDYSKFADDDLIYSVCKISKRLGGLASQQAINAIQQQDYATAVELILKYYDKTYLYEFDLRQSPKVMVDYSDENTADIAQQLLNKVLPKLINL